MKKRFIIFIIVCLFLGLSNFAKAYSDTNILLNSDIEVYSENNKFGLKNKKGDLITTAKFKKLIRVGEYSWIVQEKTRYGVIDTQGNYLIPAKYRHVERVFLKYVKLGNDNDFGLYNEKGEIVIPPNYSLIEPLFKKTFLTCRNFKYGIVSENGEVILDNEFDDIYMPTQKTLRVKYQGEWYEFEEWKNADVEIAESVKKVTLADKDLKVTHLATNTAFFSGYSALTLTDYLLKTVSSFSMAYEQTIDELMFSQGAETVSIFVKLGWIPKFPLTYIKKYFNNLCNPNNGPLFDVRNSLKRQIK